MRIVIITFLSVLVIEATGQSFNPDSELEKVFLELEVGALFVDQPGHEGNFIPFFPISSVLNTSFVQKGLSDGMSDKELSSQGTYYEKTSSHVKSPVGCCFSEGLIQGNENDNLVDCKKYVFPKSGIETGGLLIQYPSFLSRPVIKLGFRF